MIFRKRLALLLCLWISVAIGYFFWRSSSPLLVWCDSPQIAKNLFDDSRPLVWGDSDRLQSIFHYAFHDVAAEGYRPLTRAIAIAGTLFFSDPRTNPYLWFAAVGALIGFLAVAYFLVSRRFLHSDPAAVFAVLLFLFSTPIVTGAWNVFCGIQAIVPLFICVGLLLYWRAIEAPRCKGWYLIGLCPVLFLGPWFREFIGLLPILLVFLEWQRARRPTILMATAGLFFFHALYPAAVMKLTVYPDLPVKPVFGMGHLGVQAGVGTGDTFALLARMWSGIRWEVPLHFLSLYPPLLLLLVLVALLLPAFRLIAIFDIPPLGADAARMRAVRCGALLTRESGISLLFLVGSVGLFTVNWLYGIGIWLCFGLAFLAVRRDVFLALWFLLFFVPFLWVFTEQVHLAYPLLPVSIITVTAIESLWESAKANNSLCRQAQYLVIAVVALSVSDQLLNSYGSYVVVNAVNNGILITADWFRSHVPPGSIVISNALHAEDIRLFSQDHFRPLWTVRAGIPRDSDAVAAPNDLAKLLKRVGGKKKVYFLDIEFNYTPDKVNYHAHKYVRNENVAMQSFGVIHTTRALYPYLDPLKAFAARPYISFLGAPDLENDFYHGSAQDGSLFFREVYAEYRVYKVTGMEVTPWDPSSPWTFVEESYKGFNIFENQSRYIALAQSLGPVDLHKMNSRMVNEFQARGGLVIGDSLDEVRRHVIQLGTKGPVHSMPVLKDQTK
jgi:hypothetical protein